MEFANSSSTNNCQIATSKDREKRPGDEVVREPDPLSLLVQLTSETSLAFSFSP